ncbi:MAG: response regulator [Candidatus Omnitrophica bacterium]|nr:response regulator [Candidatus Omnitrophota bacterium]
MENKNIKVLVVDDEVDFRRLMTFWLQSKGYSVLVASDGNSAIQIVKEEKPDVVFMDLKMPVMDGVEAIKRIRQFDKKLPIIIISAHLDDPKENETLPYGISGIFYKGKDFDTEGLPLLESVLRTHKQLKK